MRIILAMLFALVSVVAMGQEVKVDTVVTDSVMTDSVAADSVKADTYVKQEGMTVYAEIMSCTSLNDAPA